MTEISEIRAILNLRDDSDVIELCDDAIESAITRADIFVSDLAARSSASSDLVELAKLNYAAYLAYQTYADRIVEELPGSFDQQGVFQPVANPVARQVMAKLEGLKKTADETLDLIRSMSSLAASYDAPMPADLEDYPEDFKLSNLDDVW